MKKDIYKKHGCEFKSLEACEEELEEEGYNMKDIESSHFDEES